MVFSFPASSSFHPRFLFNSSSMNYFSVCAAVCRPWRSITGKTGLPIKLFWIFYFIWFATKIRVLSFPLFYIDIRLCFDFTDRGLSFRKSQQAWQNPSFSLMVTLVFDWFFSFVYVIKQINQENFNIGFRCLSRNGIGGQYQIFVK